MKLNALFTIAALTLAVISHASADQTASRTSPKFVHPMVKVKNAMMGQYSSGALPKGFSDKLLAEVPKFPASFRAYLSNLESEKKAQWKAYVWETDEEFEHLSRKDRAAIANDPFSHVRSPYLVEIQDVYAIYKAGKKVGYVFDTADHVQATIYQDGAGIVIYTDVNFDVITTDEWAS